MCLEKEAQGVNGFTSCEGESDSGYMGVWDGAQEQPRGDLSPSPSLGVQPAEEPDRLHALRGRLTAQHLAVCWGAVFRELPNAPGLNEE